MSSAVFNWSSGKDSTLALHHVLRENNYKIKCLLTTINEEHKRVSMHGLSEEMLDAQAESIGIPLKKIYFNGTISMEAYSSKIRKEAIALIEKGLDYSIYGDIFLEDLRHYRTNIHRGLGIKLVYPLWKRNTRELLLEFIELGYKAFPICINTNKLDPSFLGRIVDRDFVNDLPEEVDPCGENGEFHTFVFDGPIFKYPVDYSLGKKSLRTYPSSSEQKVNWDNSFWYVDVLPK